MEGKSIDLEPVYSTNEIAGRCVRCLAEAKLNDCLIALLGEGRDDQLLRQKYEALVAFLRSPESQELLEESEKCLADGKKVKIKVNFADGKLQCELKID